VPSDHGELAVSASGPFGLRPIAIELNSIAIGIAQVKRLAHAVIGRALKRNTGLHQTVEGVTELRPVRIEDGKMVEARGTARWWRSTLALPGVEPDVVMVAPSGDERSLVANALRELEPEDAAVEGERAIQVGDLEMDVTDTDGGVDWLHANVVD
jgi:hypothetical protein